MPGKKLTNVQKLTELLHILKCRSNHTDGCSWYYSNPWSSEDVLNYKFGPYKEYFEMAKNLLAFANGDFNLVLGFLKAEYGEEIIKEALQRIK